MCFVAPNRKPPISAIVHLFSLIGVLRCAPVGDDGSSLWLIVWADAPYLVALALIKQGGVRAMPLGGRSLPVDAGEPVDEAPHAMAHEVVLELLVRVWQRSDDGDLRRAAGVGSLLLVELSMERLNDALPVLKAAWLETGDTAAFHQGLQTSAVRTWSVSLAKFEPVTFRPWRV